jgi:hypothetical protein
MEQRYELIAGLIKKSMVHYSFLQCTENDIHIRIRSGMLVGSMITCAMQIAYEDKLYQTFANLSELNDTLLKGLLFWIDPLSRE